jgi:hypothetical protein
MIPRRIVLGQDWRPESMSPGVEEWLRDLPDGNWAASRLPTAVLAVAARAVRSATSTDDPSEVAVARVLTRSGRWVVLHGVPLAAIDSQRVAVVVEPAHPSRIAPLLMSAYGLTEREQQLTRLVLQGFSTLDIADRLSNACTAEMPSGRALAQDSVDQRRAPEGYGEIQHNPPEEDGDTEGNDRHPGRGHGEGHCVQRRNGETGGEEDDGHSPPAFTKESQQPVRPGPEPGSNATGRLAGAVASLP